MLAEPERRRSGANVVCELQLGDQALRLRHYELMRVVVVLEHVETRHAGPSSVGGEGLDPPATCS